MAGNDSKGRTGERERVLAIFDNCSEGTRTYVARAFNARTHEAQSLDATLQQIHSSLERLKASLEDLREGAGGSADGTQR